MHTNPQYRHIALPHKRRYQQEDACRVFFFGKKTDKLVIKIPERTCHLPSDLHEINFRGASVSACCVLVTIVQRDPRDSRSSSLPMAGRPSTVGGPAVGETTPLLSINDNIGAAASLIENVGATASSADGRHKLSHDAVPAFPWMHGHAGCKGGWMPAHLFA